MSRQQVIARVAALVVIGVTFVASAAYAPSPLAHNVNVICLLIALMAMRRR